MSKKCSCSIENLFNLFEDTISPADVLTSKMMAQISNAITRERIKMRLTQKDFANHIGVTQALVSRWEHGDYNFSIKKIAEIASKLNLDVNISMINISNYKGVENYEPSKYLYQSGVIYYSKPDGSSVTNKEYLSNNYRQVVQSKNEKGEYSHVTVC